MESPLDDTTEIRLEICDDVIQENTKYIIIYNPSSESYIDDFTRDSRHTVYNILEGHTVDIYENNRRTQDIINAIMDIIINSCNQYNIIIYIFLMDIEFYSRIFKVNFNIMLLNLPDKNYYNTIIYSWFNNPSIEETLSETNYFIYNIYYNNSSNKKFFKVLNITCQYHRNITINYGKYHLIYQFVSSDKINEDRFLRKMTEERKCLSGKLIQLQGTCWLNAILNALMLPADSRKYMIEKTIEYTTGNSAENRRNRTKLSKIVTIVDSLSITNILSSIIYHIYILRERPIVDTAIDKINPDSNFILALAYKLKIEWFESLEMKDLKLYRNIRYLKTALKNLEKVKKIDSIILGNISFKYFTYDKEKSLLELKETLIEEIKSGKKNKDDIPKIEIEKQDIIDYSDVFISPINLPFLDKTVLSEKYNNGTIHEFTKRDRTTGIRTHLYTYIFDRIKDYLGDSLKDKYKFVKLDTNPPHQSDNYKKVSNIISYFGLGINYPERKSLNRHSICSFKCNDTSYLYDSNERTGYKITDIDKTDEYKSELFFPDLYTYIDYSIYVKEDETKQLIEQIHEIPNTCSIPKNSNVEESNSNLGGSILNKLNIKKTKKRNIPILNKNKPYTTLVKMKNITKASQIPKTDPIWKWSNPLLAQRQSYRYFGKKLGTIYRSTRKNKKYQIYDNINNRMVSFGQMGYEDYTKHRSLKRRSNYLTRSGKIRGDWKRNRFSANNLSRVILW